ncbi:MAG: C_GCAxxG_C_C family protein [Oscillospiraceae bacterium]|nr:C_GCAxxG_C_C family protein [Oscillospiraceae bacterium]
MDYVSKAVELFEHRFMCSQAVFAAFAEQFGITEKQALKIGACFGGGMSKAEVCGACTGALMVLGMKYGQYDENDTDSRTAESEKASEFLEEFKKRNGSYICREILHCDISTDEGKEYARSNGLYGRYCTEMVRSAAEILTEMLGDEC